MFQLELLSRRGAFPPKLREKNATGLDAEVLDQLVSANVLVAGLDVPDFVARVRGGIYCDSICAEAIGGGAQGRNCCDGAGKKIAPAGAASIHDRVRGAEGSVTRSHGDLDFQELGMVAALLKQLEVEWWARNLTGFPTDDRPAHRAARIAVLPA